MKLVAAAAERAQLRPGRGPIGRLREALGAEGCDLIGSKNEPAGLRAGHCGGFFARKKLRDRARRKRCGACFEGPLVKVRRL